MAERARRGVLTRKRPTGPPPSAADPRGSRALYERPRYYDHAFRRHRADIAFYRALAALSGGPVLELGAGTGRITLPLLRAGASVTAVDRSRAMLDRAAERALRLPSAARERLTLVQADLRCLRLRKRFALVLAPFNLFMHLYTRRDVEAALQRVAAHLSARGRFALDVLMPDLGVLRRDPARLYRCRPVFDPSDQHHYAYAESFAYDPVTQVQEVQMQFQRLDKPEVERTTPLSLRFYFPQELLSLLHYNGFQVIEHYGDFERAEPDAASEHQVIVARLARATRTRTR
jgi:SAM-dependent methyltransferase